MNHSEIEEANALAHVANVRAAMVANYARAAMFLAIGAASLGLVYL